MTISKEESDRVKEHLLKQLSSFPEDRREEMRRQVEAMTPDEIENFVKQNQLTHLGDQCIICAIVSRQVNSFEVAEDDSNLAVLELTPLSKGHTILFPKNHNDDFTSKTKQLTEFVANKLMSHFSPQKVQTKEKKIMGHKVVEVIPIYGDETERKQASPEVLSAIKESLSQHVSEKKSEPVVSKESHPKKPEVVKVKPRIP